MITGRSAGRRVVVIGAGVAGLASAWALRRAGADVLVLEAGDRIGGLVETERSDGFVIEHGPDAILGSRPAAQRALDELGLASEIERDGPAPRRAFVATDRGLVALPEGLSGLVPRSPLALFASPLLSLIGKARLALEPLVGGDVGIEPASVAAFVDARLGREPRERLVDPMLRAVYGVTADRLDLDATMPHLRAMVREHRSLGLGALRASWRPPAPGLVTLRGGMDAIVRELASAIGAERIRTRTPARAVEHRGRVRIATDRGDLEADAVIVATPAWRAAELVEQPLPALAAELASIEHVSTDVVTLGYARRAVGHALDGTGHVVASEGARTRACTWASAKWHGRAPDDRALLRSVVDAPEASDDELVSIARAELEPLLDIRARPLLTRVRRRRDALPVPGVGHPARRERIRAHVVAAGWLRLAGGATGGLGVPECLATGLAAASDLVG